MANKYQVDGLECQLWVEKFKKELENENYAECSKIVQVMNRESLRSVCLDIGLLLKKLSNTLCVIEAIILRFDEVKEVLNIDIIVIGIIQWHMDACINTKNLKKTNLMEEVVKSCEQLLKTMPYRLRHRIYHYCRDKLKEIKFVLDELSRFIKLNNTFCKNKFRDELCEIVKICKIHVSKTDKTRETFHNYKNSQNGFSYEELEQRLFDESVILHSLGELDRFEKVHSYFENSKRTVSLLKNVLLSFNNLKKDFRFTKFVLEGLEMQVILDHLTNSLTSVMEWIGLKYDEYQEEQRQAVSEFVETSSRDDNERRKRVVSEFGNTRPTTVLVTEKEELERLRFEIQNLRKEVSEQKRLINELTKRENELKIRLRDQASRNVKFGGSSKFEDISLREYRPSRLVERYGNLFTTIRFETMESLKKIRELESLSELRNKILLSVLVLAQRSAEDSLQDLQNKWRSLLYMKDKQGQSIEAASLDDAISHYLRRTIPQYDNSQNIQQVHNQICQALHEFPSLHSSQALIGYIAECVQLCWAFVLQKPKFFLKHEIDVLNPRLLRRYHSSDENSNSIKCLIWPALTEGMDGPCLFKGYVVT